MHAHARMHACMYAAHAHNHSDRPKQSYSCNSIQFFLSLCLSSSVCLFFSLISSVPAVIDFTEDISICTPFSFSSYTSHTAVAIPSWIINVPIAASFVSEVERNPSKFWSVHFSAQWIHLWFNLKWRQELNNDNPIYLFMGKVHHRDRMGIRDESGISGVVRACVRTYKYQIRNFSSP